MEAKLKPTVEQFREPPKPPMRCFRCGGTRWQMELHGMGQTIRVCVECGRRVPSGGEVMKPDHFGPPLSPTSQAVRVGPSFSSSRNGVHSFHSS